MPVILGIESLCDETSASVCVDGVIMSNVIASQTIHEAYGGVIPALASRVHQQNIVPAVQQALLNAKVSKNDIDAVAFTRGPGLLGSLLLGVSFARAFALARSMADICASVGKGITTILLNKLQKAAQAYRIKDIALAGGVLANTGLRLDLQAMTEKNRQNTLFLNGILYR